MSENSVIQVVTANVMAVHELLLSWLPTEEVAYFQEADGNTVFIFLDDVSEDDLEDLVGLLAEHNEIRPGNTALSFELLQDLHAKNNLPAGIVRLEKEAGKPGLKEYFGRSEDE